ncbi:MAG: hypothetical protein WDO73_35515 [Ignavibacteriota bacterium]
MRQIDIHRGPVAGVLAAADVDRYLGCIGGIGGSQTDIAGLTVDFTNQSLIFLVQRCAVSRESGGRRFSCQRLHAVQHRGDVAEAAIDDLQRVDAVVAVEHTLLQFRDAGGIPVSDSETGGVVTGVVDAIAGGQRFDGRSLKAIVVVQIHRCEHRCDVGLE